MIRTTEMISAMIFRICGCFIINMVRGSIILETILNIHLIRKKVRTMGRITSSPPKRVVLIKFLIFFILIPP